MTGMQKILDNGVSSGDVPFIVSMTGNAAGITWSGVSGEAAAGCTASLDTAFRIFSMTKAIGCVAAMMLIDRGKLSMDTPVASILPDWGKLSVLDGWDGDLPILRPPRVIATVRHLATHTSGLEYELYSRDVSKYLKVTGYPSILSGRKRALLSYPLTSDPGDRWGYGTGIDWLGQIVEAIDGREIDDFCTKEIFEPLGMHSTHFECDILKDRMASVYQRNENQEFAAHEFFPPAQPEFYGMGHALYSTAPDYLSFLRMFLNKGQLNGNRILSSAAMEEMLANQMQGKTFRSMYTLAPLVTADVELPEGTSHSFTCARTEADQLGGRRSGSQSWAGVCNTHFWVDLKSDIAAVFMTQSLPFFEPRFRKRYEAFEAAIYKNL
ncbi:MAG: hypothetical protein CMM69_08945 [Rhodospirillaceae bacterium]|nr:hypothetical protein [Rhodospirillaceae bacterium]OUX27161.1 MAG: hypothetical protein CBE16_09475 [Rhodospirillaceae bacterium TMED256]